MRISAIMETLSFEERLVHDDKEIEKRNKWERVIAILVLSIITMVYSGLVCSKYFPITEGWFQDYARYISQGQFIYRDFYCPVPPGYIWITTLLCNLTNYSFLALRIYGILERVALLIIVYLLLSRVYSDKITFFSLLVGSVIYSSTNTDLFYGYYQTSLLFAMVTLYFSVKMYETIEHSRRYAILYGVFSGITFCIKQNTGAFFAILIGLGYIFLMRKIDLKKAIINIIWGFLAALAVLIFLILVLAFNNAFFPFLEQVIGGTSAKGNIFSVFTSFIPRMITPISCGVFLFFCVLAVVYIASYFIIIKAEKKEKVCSAAFKYLVGTVLLCLILYGTYIFCLEPLHIGEFLSTRSLIVQIGMVVSTLVLLILISLLVNRTIIVKKFNFNYVVYMLFFCYFTAFFLYFSFRQNIFADWAYCRDLRQQLIYGLFFFNFLILVLRLMFIKGKVSVKALLYIASFSLMYIHGMSYIVEDHGTLLLFSLIIADLLSYKVIFNWLKNAVILIFGIFTILTICVQKNNFTYNWWGVNTLASSYEAVYEYTDPLLVGITGDEAQTQVLNEIYELIQTNKRDGDTMYTFPHINYFNVMANLNSPTFCKVHYFDVCSDEQAILDANTLQQKLPTFIVWQEFTENEWATHEAIFRGGNLSGQRQLRDVVDKYTKNGTYILLGVFEFNYADPIYIWGLEDGRDWIID